MFYENKRKIQVIEKNGEIYESFAGYWFQGLSKIIKSIKMDDLGP